MKKKTKVRRCCRCKREEGAPNQGEPTAFYQTGGYCKACNREISLRTYRRRKMAEGREVIPRGTTPRTRPRPRPAEIETETEEGRGASDVQLMRVIERLLRYGPRKAAEILPEIENAMPEEGQAELAALKRAIQVIAAVKGRVMREDSF